MEANKECTCVVLFYKVKGDSGLIDKLATVQNSLSELAHNNFCQKHAGVTKKV